MKLQLKRSLSVNNTLTPGVTASGLAKVPTASQLKFGEVAINYCNDDPSVFVKTVDGTIVEPYFKKNSLHNLIDLI